jgi:carbamoyltransferase
LYHDNAAALFTEAKNLAAAQEERFSLKKHGARFPGNAISYRLSEAGVKLQDIDQVVFYDKPLVKFERLLETYFNYTPKSFRSFIATMPI